MTEFIVIVESDADAQTATTLAERVLVETVDWLEPEHLQYFFRWSGLEENTEYSCWASIKRIIDDAKKSGLHVPRYIDHSKDQAKKADGAAAKKILNLVRILQKNRQIKAILFIRDLDNQPERRDGIEQARSADINHQLQLEIVIGTADRMREAWILNGFIPSNQAETHTLEEIKTQLTFDPCQEAHRLCSNSSEEPDRIRNPKVVVERLMNGDKEREKQCWKETSLELLKNRGIHTGLTAYLNEIEERLTPIILSE